MKRRLLIVICLYCVTLLACDRSTGPEEASVSEPEPAAATTAPLDGSSATPAASVNPEHRVKIEAMLGGFEHVPSAEELYAVEPQAPALRATLLEIYQDSAVKRGARQRALALMHHVPGPATNAFYESKLADAATPAAERRIIVKSYALAAGADAEAVLVEQLAHDDSHTRVASAQELGKLGTPGATAALEARAKVETAKHVRAQIGKALGRDIGDAPAAGQGVQ